MEVKIISYSYTGNNDVLAKSIASELSAEQIKITELKRRTIMTFILDILFNRTSQTNPSVSDVENKIKDCDLVIYVGPVWFGQVPTPLRIYFEKLKTKFDRYAFVSISGGANGPNPGLADELKKRVGREPVALINLYIADLLPSSPKPKMKDTQSYRLNDKDVKGLTSSVMKILRETMDGENYQNRAKFS